MTVYYVGAGGNDGNSGLTWALRKLTLNGAEDEPVVAGDTVYVAPGVYRESLTVDVSGGAGTPITYIGDYRGVYTDGIGGVVRITGSDDDMATTRATCLAANTKNYRTFRGFIFNGSSSVVLNLVDIQNWIIDQCCIIGSITAGSTIQITGANILTNTISNCYIQSKAGSYSILFSHGVPVDDTAQVVENCILINNGISVAGIGGITIRNNHILYADNYGLYVTLALTVGQTITVNNNLIHGCAVGLRCQAVAEVLEDYNNFTSNTTDRNTVNVGANSLTYIPNFDYRWFFEAVK